MKRNPTKLTLAVLLLAMCCVLMPVLSAHAAVLKQGDSGADVKKVQSRLKQWGYYSGTVDGIYGSDTVSAVKSFQRTNGLKVDGKVGPKTAAAIGITLSGGNYASSGTATSGDAYLLARVVYAEARGEPYTGQVAVAAVVLNRVRSAAFPNTITGVVYQANAFSCVNDGQINLTPDDTAIRAAKDALNGWDPSGGALYYYNPNAATDSWIFSRTTITTIGRHRFAI